MAEIHAQETQMNGGGGVTTLLENVSSKRQRRPSVRLGDIGHQPFDTQIRRTKQWKIPKESNLSSRVSRIRPLTNFGGNSDFNETLEGDEKEGNLDSVAIGSWKVKDSKSKRVTKRVRSRWASRVDDDGGTGNTNEEHEKFSGNGDFNDEFRDFDPEGSGSPSKEQSFDNMATDENREREISYRGQRRQIRDCMVSEGRDHDSVPSDTDGRGRFSGGNNCRVRIWLNGLGLGRYAPVFEVHEVDDEVLPMLTLEDLKDMGINAVGSRRKMYCAIQKLGEAFS